MAFSNQLTPEVELLTRIASLYYLEDKTQAEIAQDLDLSRPKVTRLLKKAREAGIVEINIRTPPDLNLNLEMELAKRFHLKTALVTNDQTDPDTQRVELARLVAGYLIRNLQDGDVVAVGMGRNVSSVPEQIYGPSHRLCTFVSAWGGSPLVGQPINPNDIGRRFAERMGGGAESLYAPAYAETRELRDMLFSHEDIAKTLQHARQAKFAVVGIGDARLDSAMVRMGCFTGGEMLSLREYGAVGDIFGFFFDVNGQPITNGMQDRVVGLNAQDLRLIPNVIGIASEGDKAMAILGALRTGIVDILATSVANAQLILAYDSQPRSE